MRIGRIFEYAVIMVPILVAFVAMISIIVQDRVNIVDTLKSGAANLNKRIWLIVIATILYIGLFCAFLMVTKKTEAAIQVGLNYPASSSGLNPNKTKFSVSDMVDDKVLEAAIIKGDFTNITVEDLRNCLKVMPVDAGETISVEQYYVSTEYNLQYVASKKTFRLNPQAVVQQIADCYYEHFIDTYSRKTNVLENILGDTQSIDYLDLVDIIDAKADSLQTYAVMMQADSRSFQSVETGETFVSLEKKVSNFRSVSLERFQAFVLENGLVRDKEQYISKLNYLNRVNDISYKKRLAEHQIRLETINKYERDMATIVLVPTEDQKREFYMSRTQIGVDYFAREAEESLAQAVNKQREIADNNYTIMQIVNSDANTLIYQEAEEMLESLKQELDYYAVLLKNTIKEYESVTAGNYLSIVLANGKDTKFVDRFHVKEGAALTVAFIIMYTFLLLVVQIEPKPKKQTRKSVREYEDGVI